MKTAEYVATTSSMFGVSSKITFTFRKKLNDYTEAKKLLLKFLATDEGQKVFSDVLSNLFCEDAAVTGEIEQAKHEDDLWDALYAIRLNVPLSEGTHKYAIEVLLSVVLDERTVKL